MANAWAKGLWMRRMAVLTVAALAASWIVPPASALPATDRPTREAVAARSDVKSFSGLTARRIPGEIVIGYRASVDRSRAASLRARIGGRLLDRDPAADIETVAVAHDSTVAQAVAALEDHPEVAFAEPNYIYRATATPNDARFSSLWALHNTGQSVAGATGTADADIDAVEAWDLTTGSASAVVAVVDTGVAYDHPDLASNIWRNPGETGGGKETNGKDDDNNGYVDDWRGWDFIDDDNTPRDSVGHGTHVAGTIGAQGNNSLGVTGVNWDVSIMPLRVLGDDGAGSTADVAAAVNYARANGARIVNASLGGPDSSAAVADAIVSSPNVLIVTAAGNEGANNDVTGSYPCNHSGANVVCVAATDQNDALASFSNYGLATVDIGAPGTRIQNAQPAFTRPYQETFEADISTSWVTGGIGTAWGRDLDEFGYYLTDSPGTNYASNSDSWIRTASPVDLSGHENCRLSWVMSIQTEANNDAFAIEASTNGTTWNHVVGFTGSSGGDWLSFSEELSTYDGSSVYLRFRLTSNALLNFNGVALDDVNVRCLSASYTGNEYAFFSGTSMATPHVAGVAALLLSAVPNATVASLRSGLLSGADLVPSLVGKTTTGGRLNALGALSVAAPGLVPNAVPSVGPTPTPTPTPSDSSTPTPTPTPSETIEPPMVVEHGREITLILKRHLRAKGKVLVADAFAPCLADVLVKIKRNGRLVKKTRTDALGEYKVRVRDRRGRYVARVPKISDEAMICGRAGSAVVRHRHR